MGLNKVTVDASRGSVPVAAFNRFQDNVAERFEQIESPPISVRTATAGEFRVKPTDSAILADSRGGKISIVLPVPSKSQIVILKKIGSSGNDVRVTYNAGSFFSLSDSATMICDGKTWIKQ